MVQILPAVQGFGEKLAEALGQAGSNVTKGYFQGQDRKKAEGLLGILNDPNSSPIQKVTAFSQLPEEYQKHSGSAFATILNNANTSNKENTKEQLKNTRLQAALSRIGLVDMGNTTPQNQSVGSPNNQNTPIQSQPNPSIQNNQQAPQNQPNSQQAANLQQPIENQKNAPQVPAYNQNDVKTWPEEQLIRMAGYKNANDIPELKPYAESASYELDRRKDQKIADQKKKEFEEAEKTKQFNADRAFHTKQAEDAEKFVSGLRKSVPKMKNALALSRDAVESGEVGRFSLANLAERTGIHELQTAKGAALVTAGKENLFGNLSRASAKAQNQWLEQRMTTMFPRIGQDEEANETVQSILEGEVALDEAYLNAYNQLAKEDWEKYGYVRGDIEQRAREAFAPMEEKIVDKTSFKTREVYEREKGLTWLSEHANQKVSKGTYLTPQMLKVMKNKAGGDIETAIKNAKRLGYTIPNQEEILEWRQ